LTNATPEQLTFPTVAPVPFPIVTPKPNHAVGTNRSNTPHEDSPNNGSVSNTAVAVNKATPENGTAYSGNNKNNHNSPKQSPAAAPQSTSPTAVHSPVTAQAQSSAQTNTSSGSPHAASCNGSPGAYAIPTSGSSGDFTGLPDGSIPKADFHSSILFGSELQKALFADREAAADPQLPGSDQAIDAMPAGTQPGIQTASTMVEEEIIPPTTPDRPPAGPPNLVYVPLVQRPSSARHYGGPSNHNAMPTKPETPLADELRTDFWAWHNRSRVLYSDYKKAYNAWTRFSTTESNHSKPDFASTVEQLKASAIAAQLAWTKHNTSFQKWKAANPAVFLIIANINDEQKALQADKKQLTDRDEFIRGLRGKPDAQQQHELARYDNFIYLIKQSRDREVWRSRVEAQVNAEARIQETLQAMAEEQNRLAAELERKRKEAEAEEERKKTEAKKVAEEARRLNEQMAAMMAESVEKARIEDEARRAAEAQLEPEERLLYQALGCPQQGEVSFTDCSFLLEEWSEPLLAGMPTTTATQEQAQAANGIENVAAPAVSPLTAPFENNGAGNAEAPQTGFGDVQDFQF
jgi:hypothetical protein